MKTPLTGYAYNCAVFIIEQEAEDYEDWCEENGHDPLDLKGNAGWHIYATARMAIIEMKEKAA